MNTTTPTTLSPADLTAIGVAIRNLFPDEPIPASLVSATDGTYAFRTVTVTEPLGGFRAVELLSLGRPTGWVFDVKGTVLKRPAAPAPVPTLPSAWTSEAVSRFVNVLAALRESRVLTGAEFSRNPSDPNQTQRLLIHRSKPGDKPVFYTFVAHNDGGRLIWNLLNPDKTRSNVFVDLEAKARASAFPVDFFTGLHSAIEFGPSHPTWATLLQVEAGLKSLSGTSVRKDPDAGLGLVIRDLEHWKASAVEQLGVFGQAWQKVGELLNLAPNTSVRELPVLVDKLIHQVNFYRDGEGSQRDRADRLQDRVNELNDQNDAFRARLKELEPLSKAVTLAQGLKSSLEALLTPPPPTPKV